MRLASLAQDREDRALLARLTEPVEAMAGQGTGMERALAQDFQGLVETAGSSDLAARVQRALDAGPGPCRRCHEPMTLVSELPIRWKCSKCPCRWSPMKGWEEPRGCLPGFLGI